MYTQAIEYHIAEVSGTRPVKDFLLAIRSKNSSFADTHLVLLKHMDEIDLHELVENFRQHFRLQQLQGPSKGDTHFAFSA